MCKREWFRFVGCDDVIFSETRCKRNPAHQAFENCEVRRWDREADKNYAAHGRVVDKWHPDPPIAQLAGRCVEWTKKGDRNISDEFCHGSESGVLGLRTHKPTWIMCSEDWHKLHYATSIPSGGTKTRKSQNELTTEDSKEIVLCKRKSGEHSLRELTLPPASCTDSSKAEVIDDNRSPRSKRLAEGA